MSDPVDNKRALERFAVAALAVSTARDTGALRSDDGMTVLIHDQPFTAQRGGDIVCHSSLGDRQRVRHLLIHALYASLLADGATEENVGEMAAREIRQAFGVSADNGGPPS